MTFGKISYRRGPDTSGFLPSQFPLWIAGFVTRFDLGIRCRDDSRLAADTLWLPGLLDAVFEGTTSV